GKSRRQKLVRFHPHLEPPGHSPDFSFLNLHIFELLKRMVLAENSKETCTPELLRNVEKAIARGKTGNKLTLRTVDRKSLEQ
ncbi:UNVERIFIED_CONTAM: hypothetical protein QO022_41080, partial [Pseudomonas aeruginosa]